MANLDRRGFLVTTSAAVALQFQAPSHAGAEERLQSVISRAVWMERSELPSEENAFTQWEAAIRATQSLNDLQLQSIERLPAERSMRESNQLSQDFSIAMDTTGPFPDGPAGDLVRSWHRSSAAAYSLFEDGLRRGRYQIPAEHLGGFLTDGSADPSRRPVELGRWQTVAFNLACQNQDWAAADRAILNLLTIAKLVLNSDGYAIHRLFHSNPLYRAVDAILSRLRAAPMTMDSRQAIANALTDCESAVQSWPNTLRMEVCHHTAPQLAKLPSTDNLKLFIDGLLQQSFRFRSGIEKAVAENQAARRVRDGMLQLFADHPRPFDLDETIRAISDVAAAMIADRHTLWLKRRTGFADAWQQELEPWPQALRFRGNDRIINEMFFGPDKSEPAISVEEISKARTALLNVSNPIGKLIAVHDMDDTVRQVSEIGMFNINAARCGLAIRQYRDRHQQAPETLSEAVDGEYLREVPIDPFSGKPLQYDRGRGIVWSFGTNEQDDGGNQGANANGFAGDDFVWPMPV
ncbi:MAG: hypothetical protein U0795_10845 [Pirellulales bacterium]